MALVDVVCHQLADVFQIVAGGKNAVEPHLFELRFNVGKVMLSDHQIAADVKENVADTAFDAALAQSQAIDIAVAVNRRHDDGIRTSFDGGINIFILADHHAQIDYAKIMGSKNAVQDFIAYCMAVSTNDANNEC